MKKICLLSMVLSFYCFSLPVIAQNAIGIPLNKDSVMERLIKNIIESAAIRTADIPEDFKTYSLLFIINYDSASNGNISVSIDTFIDSKLPIPGKRMLYRHIVSDTIKIKKIISLYHPSVSLSIIFPLFRNVYPTDSNSIVHYPELEKYMNTLIFKIKDCYIKKRELLFFKPLSSYYREGAY